MLSHFVIPAKAGIQLVGRGLPRHFGRFNKAAAG